MTTRGGESLRSSTDVQADPALGAASKTILITVREDFQAARAALFAWLEKLCPAVPGHGGDYESVVLIHEALKCYLEGYFIATIMTAAAHAEHSLVEELLPREFILPNPSPPFGGAIDIARGRDLFRDASGLAKLDQLRLVRNPLTRRKAGEYQHSVRTRSRAQRRARQHLRPR